MVSAILRPRPWWGALLCAVAPGLLARAHPARDLPAPLAGTDPLLQSAILEHVAGRAIWETNTWHAPFFAPAPWSLTFMDPLWGQWLLVWWMPPALVTPALRYNLCLGATLALAFGFTFLLARAVGLRRGVASLAGLVYALGPYAMGHLQHLNQLPSPWLPLALWALMAIGQGRDWGAVVWGVALLMQVASGVYGLAALLLVNVAVVPLLLPRWDGKRRLGFGIAVLAVAAAVWGWSLPYREAAAVLPGFARDAADVGPFAARIPDLWHAPAPRLLPWPAWIPGRPVLYPGVGWGLLAAVGLGILLRRRGGRAFWWGLLVAAGLGFVLALGRSHPVWGRPEELPLPLAYLQDQIWPLRALRAPARFFLPATLLLALAGAVAVESGWVRAASRRGRVAFVLGLGLVLVDLAPGATGSVRATPDAEERQILDQIRAIPAGATWTVLPQPCRERDEGPREARAMLWAALTQVPLVGGTSGFVPEETAALRRTCCGAPLQCQRRLRDVGVALIVMPVDRPAPVSTLEMWRGQRWKTLRPLRTASAPVR